MQHVRMRMNLAAAASLGLMCGLISMANGQSSSDPLESEFSVPPNAAKPYVWWHWINGSVTKEGIRLDLEWMKRIGVGGIQNFDGAFGTESFIEHPLTYMSQDWNDTFRFAVSLADQEGLEFGVADSPGWSESGGTWVPPEQGMKKLVWSELNVRGGKVFSGRVLRPPDTIGPFQNVPADWSNPVLGSPPQEALSAVYQDVAVIAFPAPDEDPSPDRRKPLVSSSAGAIDSEKLWDGDVARAARIPFGEGGQPAWILFDWRSPQQIQSMTLALDGTINSLFSDPSIIVAQLESSEDGVAFHTVAKVHAFADIEQTVTFAPVTARYFRLALPTPPVSPMLAAIGLPAPKGVGVTEFQLYSEPRVDHFEQKAGFFAWVPYFNEALDRPATRHVAKKDAIDRNQIIDLTANMQRDGTLNWKPPPGRWVVLRLGYSLLGMTHRGASAQATGLEVDKLSRVAVKAHMKNYLDRFAAFLGPQLMGQHGLHAVVNDSWEAGAQNWTDDLPAEFARRRGYDPRPWMPALTGRIIESAEATDKFLWDFRRTLGELVAEYHYGEIAADLHRRGMIHYNESHETGRAFIGDGMDAKRFDDVPMGAMWDGDFKSQSQLDADLIESASVGHIYAKRIVGAESMTTLSLTSSNYAFAFTPEQLKSTVDREFADGINRIIVHASVHQPLTKPGPGVTLGPTGQWFTRNETWAEQAGPWVSYLSRSSYLMQQGQFVADVIYFYGQDSNITALYADALPAIPEGYAFDFASAHALTMLSVSDGKLVTKSGMHYRVLVLDPRTQRMSLDVLKDIARLVGAGATVVGKKPLDTPSLADNARRFQVLARAVWGKDAEHSYGKGHVMSGRSLDAVLSSLKVVPDFSYSKPEADASVWYAHRHLNDGDIYFVDNRKNRAERIEARFRVHGKAAQLWHADTGLIEPASYRIEGDQTVVPLPLEANEAVFVVFRQGTQESEREVPQVKRGVLAMLPGPWTVQFQNGRGAPEKATFAELKSWTENANAGVKYFSGTAEYQTAFTAPALSSGQRLEIDLGSVKNLAEVLVNDKAAGIVWKPPFRVDVTDVVHPGVNQLQVRVTNLWVNRLIGDKQSDATPIAFTTFNPYTAQSPLLDSGLLGPVTLATVTGGTAP